MSSPGSRGGVGIGDRLRENRGAGDGSRTSFASRKNVPRAAMCGSVSTSPKLSTGVTQASESLNTPAQWSRSCAAKAVVNAARFGPPVKVELGG